MKSKKGFIDSISYEENIGFISEVNTGIVFVFFLDQMNEREVRMLLPGTPVIFNHDLEFETSMFVAENIKSTVNEVFNRKAI